MRKRLLINPRLQFRHLIWTLSMVLICFLAGYLLFESIAAASLREGNIAPEVWSRFLFSMRWGFALILVMLLAGIGIENYFFFHSIAGPLYALEKGLRRLSQGDFTAKTKIRTTDELGELVHAFDQMKTSIQHRIEVQEKTARLLALELDRILKDTSSQNIANLQSKLREIRENVEKKAA